MASASERLIDAQRAMFETSQTIGRKALDGAGQLLELNMQATSSLLAAGPHRMAGLAASVTSDGTAGTPQPNTAAFNAYVPRLMEIVSNTHGEIGRLLLQQASEMQSLFSEMLSAGLESSTNGNGGLFAMMGAPFKTMQRASTQTSRAAVQTAEAGEQVAHAGAQVVDTAMRAGRRPLQSEE